MKQYIRRTIFQFERSINYNNNNYLYYVVKNCELTINNLRIDRRRF